MLKFKLITAVLLGGFLLLGLLKINMLSAENEALESRLAEIELVNQSLNAELSANRAALSARENEGRRLAGETMAQQQKIKEQYDNDPNAQIWSDTLCPGNLLDCLRP